MADYLVCALLIGAGATAVMDLWALVRKRLLRRSQGPNKAEPRSGFGLNDLSGVTAD